MSPDLAILHQPDPHYTWERSGWTDGAGRKPEEQTFEKQMTPAPSHSPAANLYGFRGLPWAVRLKLSLCFRQVPPEAHGSGRNHNKDSVYKHVN